MIALNGETVPGFNLRIRAGFQLADEELSGQGASTARAEQGIKPQTLNVSLEIKQDSAEQLTQLVTLARATEEDGTRTIYNIVNPLAAACKIRAVVFTDNFTVNEQADKRAWSVSFVLAERESRAEEVEERQEAATTTTAEASTAASDTSAGEQTEQAASKRFDRVSDIIDKVINRAETAENTVNTIIDDAINSLTDRLTP